MFLNNRPSIHFSDESHSIGIEEFVPKNSLGQKKIFWPMDKICLFTESSSVVTHVKENQTKAGLDETADHRAQ